MCVSTLHYASQLYPPKLEVYCCYVGAFMFCSFRNCVSVQVTLAVHERFCQTRVYAETFLFHSTY